MLFWETYMSCKHLGIPVIVATFDRFRPYPPNMKADLRRIPSSKNPIVSQEEVAASLISVVQEARDQGKLLILDTKAGFRPHDSMFAALISAELETADSISALVAVWSGIDKSRDPFAEAGITFARTFFRFWGFKSDLSRAPCDDITHRWIPRFISKAALYEINEEPAMNLPIVMCGSADELQVERSCDYSDEVLEHLSDATKHISRAILEPISNPIPEVPDTEC